MILEEETFEKFGYYPSDLKPKSNKKILARCGECRKIREIEKRGYRPFCHSCVIKGKKSNLWTGGKTVFICEFCGEFFETYETLRTGKHVFCSSQCEALYQSKNQRGKAHPLWKRVEQKCIICGKIFFLPPSKIKENGNNYCSQSCTDKAHKQIKIKRICQRCGKTFFMYPSEIKVGRGKFCSYFCARKSRKFQSHHTKPELIFEEICKKYNLPYKYTGDGSFWIGNNPSVNPDFVECNGKKLAIEIFGDYWHSPLLKRNMRYSQTYRGREKILKKYGWELIVFWETDLLRKDAESFILSQLNKISDNVKWSELKSSSGKRTD